MKDIKGEKFDYLTALYPLDERDSQGYVKWVCQCECGNLCVKTLKQLISYGKRRKIKSCPICAEQRRLNAVTTHKASRTRLYGVYKSMIQRCTNKNSHEYTNYGGRGIKVCDEWSSFDAFREWAYANGYKEEQKGRITLDRIDVDGDYSPSNCRFVDMKVQQRNRRNNVYLTHNGETHCLSEWAEIVGVRYGTLAKRYEHGWATSEILMGR